MALVEERAYNLVTVAQLQQWIGFVNDPTAREVDALTLLANAITEKIEDYIGRPVVARSRTDYLNGDNHAEISLRYFPTAVLTSLEILNPYDGTTWQTFTTDEYHLDAEVGRVRLFRLYFPRGHYNVKVVHSPGWVPPAVPEPITVAARFWANKLYKEWQGGSANDEIQSQSLDGMNTTYFVGEMPKKVTGLLAGYKLPGWAW